MQARTAKICKVCSQPFQAWSQAQRLNKFCGPICAAKWGHEKATKRRLTAMRKERAKARERLKTRGDWQREAQAAFNSFIRERDYGKPCISCGTLGSDRQRITGSEWDCGHYRSVGAAPHLRFYAFNAARQCTRCNRELSGNAVEFRKGLALRIGAFRLEALEADDTARKYNTDDLKRIKRIFGRRARNYKKWRAC